MTRVPNANDLWSRGRGAPPPFEHDDEAQETKIIKVPMLAPMPDGSIPAGAFKITSVGLEVETSTTVDEWWRVGKAIFKIETASQWLIGDWIRYGEARFNKSIYEVAELLKRDPKTLQNWSWVCSKFPISRRREKLFFSHHEAVAKRPVEQQDLILDAAAAEGWSLREMRQQIPNLLPKLAKKSRRPRKRKHVDHFRKRLGVVYQKLQPIVTDADRNEKLQMAAMLREWVAELEEN